MCCRYTLQTLPALTAFANEIDAAIPADWNPRFNAAPTDRMPVILQRGERARAQLLPFGFPAAGRAGNKRPQLLANARIETLLDKPSFREATHSRRCLIPADGFYEWETQGSVRLPHYFHLRDAQPFYFAGLWQQADAPDEPLGFVIVTTTANTLLQPIHDRMPVILGPNSSRTWLGHAPLAPGMLARFARPLPVERMASHRVTPRLNNVRYQAPDCPAPLPITPGNTPAPFSLITSPG